MRKQIQYAKKVFQEEGSQYLIGESLQYIGRIISNGSKNKRKQQIIQNYSDNPRFLNLGGGDFIRADWRCMDYYTDHYSYNEILVDYPIDLEDLEQWPIESDSYDILYSSATLEHLSDDAIDRALDEAYRILKPGGGIHVTVPDTEFAFEKYLDSDVQWMQEIRGVAQEENLRYSSEYIPEYFLIRWFASAYLKEEVNHEDGLDSFLKTVRKDANKLEFEEFLNKYKSGLPVAVHRRHPGGHRNWMTEDRVQTLLSDAGFSEIERIYARQSRFTELCHHGFDPRPQWSVHIEGIKPMK